MINRKIRKLHGRHRKQDGIALIEAMVAIILLGIGLFGVIGMQARSYAALSDTGMRAEATIAANNLIGLMANDIPNLSSYALAADATPSAQLTAWVADTKDHIPGARPTVQITPVAGATNRTQVVITIAWARKTDTPDNQHVVTSYIANAS